MTVVARAVGTPTLTLVALGAALSGSGRSATGLVPLGLGVVGYSLLFGVVIGGLSRWAAVLAPGHGRLLLTVLVGLPMVSSELTGPVPGVVSGFAWLGDRVGALGSPGG